MKILSFREVVLSALLLGFVALSVQQCTRAGQEADKLATALVQNDTLLNINHNLVAQRDRAQAHADSLTTAHEKSLAQISTAIGAMPPAVRTQFNRSQLAKLGLLR